VILDRKLDSFEGDFNARMKYSDYGAYHDPDMLRLITAVLECRYFQNEGYDGDYFASGQDMKFSYERP
jgi:hypothetical protein